MAGDEFRRIFSRKGLESETNGIRLTLKAWEALEALVQYDGDTRNDIVAKAIDEYLQKRVKEGAIKIPEDILPVTPESKSSIKLQKKRV